MNHPQVPLGEVVDFVNGAAFKPEDWGEDGLPIIRIQNLTDSDKSFNYTERIVPQKLVVNPGDLLVSWSATLGVFQWNGPKGLLNQHIFRVLPNDEVVDKNYLKHTLGQAINDMERHLHGATMKHVNRGEFLGTRIPLPSLEEQRRIAAILDKADSIHHLSLRAISRLSQTLESGFRNLSKMTATECPSKPLEEVVEAIIDYRGKSPEKTAEGIPLITARVIKEGRILPATEFIAEDAYSEWMRRGMPKQGDVVFTTEAPLGQVAQIVDPNVALAQRLVLLRGKPQDLDNTYLRFALRMKSVTEQIRKRATGSTVLGIRQKELRRVEVPLPPLTKQKEFAKLALTIEAEIQRLRRRKICIRGLTESLAIKLLKK
jgi:type I restriction enzyme S subunit